MASPDPSPSAVTTPMPRHLDPSAFECLIAFNPPILESLLAQIPTQTLFALYHTSYFLRQFLQSSPTAWRYISWRLYQPALSTATTTNNSTGVGPRQSSNYALDQLLIYVINPFSTRLVTLELDNTAVSGATLFQTVLILRKDTLEHVSVRGCKNVSLKYHINPWLTMHALAQDRPENTRPPGYEALALKSLYTYRCRHHRRRPYLPSSLVRKESDSEPTHDLVLACHRLGIWTDTAWCTTPGARCYRRRGYVTMRVPQDPREVWVVYDRLWRSRNWLGPTNHGHSAALPSQNRRPERDCRSWEFGEEAINGEPVGVNGEGKATPAHLRQSHRQFVDDILCDNCSDAILERCEQCSVLMHCSGCRKTLCASCAFDRPYLRNKSAAEDEKNKIWWAPGCAVSPCSMQDQDFPPAGPAGNAVHNPQNNLLPSIKFRWCCTEPVFSGGGGITFGSGSNKETDRIRAAPLKIGQGWEDAEFSSLSHEHTTDLMSSMESSHALVKSSEMSSGLGGRWSTIDSLFRKDMVNDNDQPPPSVPRILCDGCYSSDHWKVKCKACAVPLCLRHDVRDRLKVRICGYKDLAVEKQEFRSRQKALKLLTTLVLRRRDRLKDAKAVESKAKGTSNAQKGKESSRPVPILVKEIPGSGQGPSLDQRSDDNSVVEVMRNPLPPIDLRTLFDSLSAPLSDIDHPVRPISPGSNSTAPPSRSSSPTPSAQSIPATPEPRSIPRRLQRPKLSSPKWRGCQSFFCPATRAPGDHRRRCVAIMRQCMECKVHVCADCVAVLEPPCPCKGCRVSKDDLPTSVTADVLRFFCPNCRWSRMQTGKCKRKPAVASGLKGRKKRERTKKPVEERRSNRTRVDESSEGIVSDAVDGLVEFFDHLDTGNGMPTEMEDQVTDDGPESRDEIRELEDMGTLARDLIRRIQRLREQFRPGSLAATALPDIRLQDHVDFAAAVAAVSNTEHEPEHDDAGEHVERRESEDFDIADQASESG